MLNASNTTHMDTPTKDTGQNMAWLLPTLMAVFMVIFLLVSFVLHHRRFRGRYKRKELLEYYLELQVEDGLKRIAAPTTSSMRTKDIEETPNTTKDAEKSAVVNFVARASIDSAFSIVMTPCGQNYTSRKKKLKKATKVRHRDSGLFKIFGGQSKWPSTPVDPKMASSSDKPRTISESVEESLADNKNSLNVYMSSPLPPISPVPSPVKRKRSSLRSVSTPSPLPARGWDTACAADEKPSFDKTGAILLSARALTEEDWLKHAQSSQTPV